MKMEWDKGEEQTSLKEELLLLFQQNADSMWTVPELRSELYPELELSFDHSGPDDSMESMTVLARTATIHSLLEVLVAEGKVVKREFRVDEISLIAYNEKEYEEISEVWDDDPMTDMMFYRLAR